MDLIRKVISSVVIIGSFGFANDVLAARSCSVIVDDIQLNHPQVIVKTTNSITHMANDKLTLAYQDTQFGQILEKLVEAKGLETPVKIYILEEFNGDDARSCSDSITDYIGSVHRI
ncbi:hypothetical protein [Pseudoalteromonas sp. MMG007]|uniref:hypothetical protein n=1 Tax=Pseudoalteromonas sp. MMG007 TaxID=2822684 RepID=UPI001B38CEF0|nr:hypothetical protein [Pseudoalteromonas sp. MMG007]MBQ4859296.1 hypothetical protein [Pseudoalteromonas sp. MMG007]